jgi:hypothetical protein
MSTYAKAPYALLTDSEVRRLGQQHRLETGLALAVNDA